FDLEHWGGHGRPSVHRIKFAAKVQFSVNLTMSANGGDLHRSTQHTLRTSLLAFDIARSCEGVR
ncbi:hypothetical protein AB9F29_21845, partial [Falsihalocynthiibacter sp. S25ZX9]|uniref:hypothetical protein n=1 Tax=Falsihalocynthiibacter sp. S25ZX9 TaxID=3240870 RepID=UPI00350F257E